MTLPAASFLPLAPEHLGLLHGWLQQPHVRAFWDDGHRTLEQVHEHYYEPDDDAASFVFTLAGHVAGYLQTYRVGPGAEYARWRSPVGETWGLDLLLGDAADTGQGHAPRVIRAFVAFWQAARPDLTRLLIDPDVRNIRAVRAYQNAGFTVVGERSGTGTVYRMLTLEVQPYVSLL